MAERHKKNFAYKKQLVTLLFADDQVIISNTEDNLQKAAYKLNQIITERGLTASVQKTELVPFKGRQPVKSKIVMDNKITEKVSSFNCLGNLVSCEEEVDIDSKLNDCLKTAGIINNTFRPQNTLKKKQQQHCTIH